MISFANTLGSLLKEAQRLMDAFGPDTPVGNAIDLDGVEHIDELISLDLVYIDGEGRVVGDEANDYQPRPGERRAIRVR